MGMSFLLLDTYLDTLDLNSLQICQFSNNNTVT
jgi:hypothetical protein